MGFAILLSEMCHYFYRGYMLLFIVVLLLPELSSAASDVRSLLEFKKGIYSDPSGRVLTTWDRAAVKSDRCPSSWHGIVCDDAGANVSAIVLDGLGLIGDLKFSTLNGLKMLKNLSLSGNSLTGRLVPAIGTMTSLLHLDLSRNQFYGPIPYRITQLWGLRYLNLSSNNFTGWIPSGIRNLNQLKFVDLHLNRFTGDIGILLSELLNAEYVDISSNLFYGSFLMDSQILSGLANTVRHLNLSSNGLDGGLFKDDSIHMFHNLEVLDVSHNRIAGKLPSFHLLQSLRVCRAANNLLDGYIPSEIVGSSMLLEELDLSGNRFSGTIQNISSSQLKLLNLSSNALSGSLPSDLRSCVNVDLSSNMIDGDISLVQSWGDTLVAIDLSSNALSGSLPNATTLFSRLTSMKIRNNSLVGVLPDVLGSSPTLTSVDLSFNKLEGPILSSFFTSLALINLDLSGNCFTGSIPLERSDSVDSLGQPAHSNMESLDLSDNSLTGALPREIGNMERLRLLNLRKNLLSGHIPSEITKLSNIEYLDLSRNKLIGKVPDRLSLNLKVFNVSLNNLSGIVPENLRRFPNTSFHPGNDLLIFSNGMPLLQPGKNVSGTTYSGGKHHPSRSNIKVLIVVGTIAAMTMIVFVLIAYYRIRWQELNGRNGLSSHNSGRHVKLGRFAHPTLLNFHKNAGTASTTASFSNDRLLASDGRSALPKQESAGSIAECGAPNAKESGPGNGLPALQLKSSPGSPISSPHFMEIGVSEQPVVLSVYSPDRLAGDLFFLDGSLVFTAEELSRAPAEVLGRSSHGTSYKATLDSGHMLTVKWLRVGLVKCKKEFDKEIKRIGTIRHPNIVPLRCYYWGPREQERLIITDYINGESLALHLYEATPRSYSLFSFSQRLKIAIDVARCLYYLHHDKGLPHGNLKPTNIILVGPDLTAQLTDYGLHRLMTPVGTAEQILNLGALGYRAPELATASKPFPSCKADVYAFGVILMELLTRRSAGEIISGQSGAVDLTDWVRLCAGEGRGIDCFDKDIAAVEETPKAMDELLAVSLRCILPVNERPNIRTIFEDLCSITV